MSAPALAASATFSEARVRLAILSLPFMSGFRMSELVKRGHARTRLELDQRKLARFEERARRRCRHFFSGEEGFGGGIDQTTEHKWGSWG
jgi:hypothetical protein